MAKRRGTTEAVTDFILLGDKATADDDCSHEINRHLLHCFLCKVFHEISLTLGF